MIELTLYIYWIHKYNYLVVTPFKMKYIVNLELYREYFIQNVHNK